MTDINRSAALRFYVLAVAAFVIATFSVQATSHFTINAAHYAAIEFARKDPIMELGILAMVVQGVVLAFFYPFCYRPGSPVLRGLKYGLLMGLFLGSYIAFAEPAKYTAPSVTEWIIIEGLASLTQFSLYGVLVALIYDKFGKRV